MTPAKKRGPYHHGDLRAALIDTAVELIASRGVRGFSLSEASRHLGVSVAAPYRHFADRDELLVAVAARALSRLADAVTAAAGKPESPADRLADAARAYVRFAGDNRPLFEALFVAGVDKSRHPELGTAGEPVSAAFVNPARAVCGGSASEGQDLAVAVAIAAHGHAALFLDGAFGKGDEALETAVTHAAAVTHALVTGRAALRGPTS